MIGRGADVIKFASTGGVNSRIGAGLGKQMFDDEAQAIVDTAHPFGHEGRGPSRMAPTAIRLSRLDGGVPIRSSMARF